MKTQSSLSKIILGSSLALMLSLSPSSAQSPQSGVYRDGISGMELQELAQSAMQAARVSGQLSISSVRGYPPCATAPHIAPKKGGWSMITVTCTGNRSWTRHIRTTIKPAAYNPRSTTPELPQGPIVATLARSLRKDAVITAADIEMRAVSRSTADGSFSDPRHVIGQKLSKNLGEGRAIQARHLQKNWTIHRDMPVAIQLKSRGMSISTPGISLENGSLGDYIEVQNLSSGTVLKGKITGPQKITVRAKTH
jgi:flagella basal body P-ring formation protein FlgA